MKTKLNENLKELASSKNIDLIAVRAIYKALALNEEMSVENINKTITMLIQLTPFFDEFKIETKEENLDE